MSTIHLRVANRGVCPDFVHESIDELNLLGDADAAVVMHSTLGGRPRRRFRLEWSEATAGQAWEVEQLFQAAGTTRTMNYVPPDETAIVEVRFADGTLNVTQLSVNHFKMSFEVVEALR